MLASLKYTEMLLEAYKTLITVYKSNLNIAHTIQMRKSSDSSILKTLTCTIIVKLSVFLESNESSLFSVLDSAIYSDCSIVFISCMAIILYACLLCMHGYICVVIQPNYTLT